MMLPAIWHRYREQILYLLVGGWNTLFQYAVFSACWYLLHEHLHPDVILLIAYCIASVNGFLGFRHVVFGPGGHVLLEYLKYQLVYMPILLVNMIILPLLLHYSPLSAYAIQAIWAVVAVILAYLGNKYFTFRKSPGGPAEDRTSAES